jgi:hypothetical protein
MDEVVEGGRATSAALDQLEQRRRGEPVAVEPDQETRKSRRNAPNPSRAMTQKSSP